MCSIKQISCSWLLDCHPSLGSLGDRRALTLELLASASPQQPVNLCSPAAQGGNSSAPTPAATPLLLGVWLQSAAPGPPPAAPSVAGDEPAGAAVLGFLQVTSSARTVEVSQMERHGQFEYLATFRGTPLAVGPVRTDEGAGSSSTAATNARVEEGAREYPSSGPALGLPPESLSSSCASLSGPSTASAGLLPLFMTRIPLASDSVRGAGPTMALQLKLLSLQGSAGKSRCAIGGLEIAGRSVSSEPDAVATGEPRCSSRQQSGGGLAEGQARSDLLAPAGVGGGHESATVLQDGQVPSFGQRAAATGAFVAEPIATTQTQQMRSMLMHLMSLQQLQATQGWCHPSLLLCALQQGVMQ
jgi:hypothetical protein